MKMNNLGKECIECGKNVRTISDTPLCSKECHREYAQGVIANMSDEDAHCPSCGNDFDSVRAVCYHHNQKHPFELHRKSSCENCGDSFIPSSHSNDCKYCSRDCFAEDKRILKRNVYGRGNWKTARSLALQRDFKQCRGCRMSNDEHMEKYGKSLDVHHKIPARMFDDLEDAHKLHNLITLCRDCHISVEREVT